MSRPTLLGMATWSFTIKAMMRHEVGRKSDHAVDITLSFRPRLLDPDPDAARGLLHLGREPSLP